MPGSFSVGSDLFNSQSTYAARLHKAVNESPVLGGRVTFLPYTEPIDPVYQALEVVVVPSRREAFGRVALEAMQAGVPVVAARTGGLAELIQDEKNGLLFEPDDPSGLAQCIIRLAGDPGLRARLIEGGWATAASHRAMEPVLAAEMRAIYEEALAS